MSFARMYLSHTHVHTQYRKHTHTHTHRSRIHSDSVRVGVLHRISVKDVVRAHESRDTSQVCGQDVCWVQHCGTCTATRCNTLQHAATLCNTLQHTATRMPFWFVNLATGAECVNKDAHWVHGCRKIYTLQHTATHCNTLQHTATHYNTLQHTATHTP